MKFSVRQTRDLSAVEILHRSLFPDSEFEPGDLGNVYWLATAAEYDRAVGFCSVRPARFSPDDTVFLSRAGVLPFARGRGLQRQMIRVRLRWARRQGFKRAVTYTLYGNIPSARNLVREGFIPYQPAWLWADDVSYFEQYL